MKSKQRVIKFMTEKEVRKIIDTIPNNHYEQNRRDKALLELLFSTGLRISEALNLRVSDFTDRTPDASGTLELGVIGKGGWQRTIYVSPRALKAVKSYFEVRRDDYYGKRGKDIEPGAVPSDRAFCIGVRGVQVMVKKRAKKAGINRNITPHQFRHSFACHVLDSGANILYVKEFLGHKNLSTTDVYLHVRNSDLERMHGKIFGNKDETPNS